jgi:hypothetical protein
MVETSSEVLGDLVKAPHTTSRASMALSLPGCPLLVQSGPTRGARFRSAADGPRDRKPEHSTLASR